jgi:DNA-binding NtrC family response regulator
VQDNYDLGSIWARFLARNGVESRLATDTEQAIAALQEEDFDALVLEVVMPSGSSLAVADFAQFRKPDIPIIAVTKSSFFSDGSIFDLIPNARGFIRAPLRPSDLVAYIEHCAPRAPQSDRRRVRGG